MHFRNRVEAGKQLAEALAEYKNKEVVVYALPRGGVVIGAEVARALAAPLDLVIVRKVSHPGAPEYAVAAVSESGQMVKNEGEETLIKGGWFRKEVEKERAEAKRRRETYLAGREPAAAEGKTAILVDDGIATGLTVIAAISELKAHYRPQRIVVAAPVAPKDTADKIWTLVDQLVVLNIPAAFAGAVGAYYDDFPDVEDAEVIRLMREANSPKS